MESPKQVLSIRVNPSLYQRLKKSIGYGRISEFAERVIARELDNYEKKLDKEQQEFQQKLIAGYKIVAKNKKIQKELAVWDETVSDMWKKDER